MQKTVFQNVVWKEDKHYVAQCLNVDVSSFGESRVEALANLQEAIELYFEDQPTGDITHIERPTVVKRQLAYA